MTETETEIATSGGDVVAEQPAVDGTADVLDMIVRAATDPAVDVAKMERLMDLHDRITNRRAEILFGEAMADAQTQMEPVRADAKNDQTKSRFASFAALDSAVRPIYTKYGFSLSFDSGAADKPDDVRVICHVAHRGGFTRTYHVDMPADGKGAKGGDVMTKTHATGSAFTYGQRYLLKLIFNIAVDMDDDGNAASRSGPSINEKQKARIIELQQEVGADTAPFLKYLGVATIDVLPAAEYNRAIGALEEKRRAAAEKAKGVG